MTDHPLSKSLDGSALRGLLEQKIKEWRSKEMAAGQDALDTGDPYSAGVADGFRVAREVLEALLTKDPQ